MKDTTSQRLFVSTIMALFLSAPFQISHADSLISFELEKAKPESNSLLKLNSKTKVFELKKAEPSKAIPQTKIVKAIKENKKAILIMDASGSMWGKIDNKPKIEIAKEVVGKTIKDWTEKVDLGLIAYGHNRKGDCSDIEMLIEPEPLNVEAYMTQANKLNPKGKTPLTAAVVKAAEALKYSEEKATVILVSDGKETCDLDPCQIGETLEQRGIDFTAHVIGFDVSVEDSAGLRCMAEKTGGVYLDAKNAEDLQEAMNATREATIKAEPELEPVDYGKATITVPDEVIAGSEFSAEWTGPKNIHDYLRIKTEDAKLSFASTNVGKPEITSPTILLAPEKEGTYIVHYEVNATQSIGSTLLNVVPPKVTVETTEEVAQGSKFEVMWSGPLNKGDVLRVFKADGTQYPSWASLEKNTSVSPATLKAPDEIGEYEVRYMGMHGHAYAKSSFKVVESLASVNAPETVLAGSVFEVEWSGPKNKYDNLRIFSADGKDLLKFIHIDNDKDVSPVSLRAPTEPGKYEVRYLIAADKALAKDSFIVTKVSATVDAPETVKAGSEFGVEWTGPRNKNDRIYIFDSNGKKMFEFTSVDREKSVSPAFLTAPIKAGKYSVRFLASAKKQLAEDSFIVTEISATIDAPASVEADSKFMVNWTGPKNKTDQLRFYTLDGKNLNNRASIGRKGIKSPVKIRAPRKAGQYEIKYVTTGGRILATEKIMVIPPTDSENKN